MRIAFVHDYLTQYGGAERVLEVLYDMYADNPRHVYTSIIARDHLPPPMREWLVTTSGLARLPLARRTRLVLLPLYPHAFRHLGQTIAAADIVIADTSAWSHHAAPANDAPFLVYCHSPARFLYGDEHYLRATGATSLLDRVGKPMLDELRRQDVAAAQRPDRIIANSLAVQERVRNVWDRDSVVIHPPVETASFTPAGEPETAPWSLVVSRLVPHKWISRAIEASNLTGLPLRIIGSGRAERALRAIAGPQVEFLGQRSDAEIARAMQQCQALLVPGIEDFGMTAVEVQAAGRPVIAARGGGALETVRDGITGLLVPVGDVEALGEAMREVARRTWNRAAIMANADDFDARHFRTRIRAEVDDLIGNRVDERPDNP